MELDSTITSLRILRAYLKGFGDLRRIQDKSEQGLQWKAYTQLSHWLDQKMASLELSKEAQKSLKNCYKLKKQLLKEVESLLDSDKDASVYWKRINGLLEELILLVLLCPELGVMVDLLPSP